MNILEMSVQAAVMIVFIVIIRALSMGRLPKWSFQALWGIVLLRLLVPLSIESPLSIYGALEAAKTTLIKPPPVTINVGTPIAPISVVSSVAPVVTQAQGAHPVPISPWLLAWIIGMACMTGFFLLTHIRCRRIYAQSLPRGEIQVRGRAVFVRISDRVSAPLTYGLLRPVVLLPKKLSPGEDVLSYVLAHELAHIRHFDALKKWLLTAALCLHWFNPMVWVMFILANRDIELCCDESVLRGLRDDARVSYATMLIDLMQKRDGLMPLASHFSRNATEERIVSIMKHKRVSFFGIILALVLVVFTASALATNAVSAIPSPSQGLAAVESISVYAPQTEDDLYAKYASFGLTHNTSTDRFYLNGELVRYFEDTFPVEGGYAGMTSTHPDGTVDAYAMRDLTPIYNPDGSYDPSGRLIGIGRRSQTEFDRKTEELAKIANQDDHDNAPTAMSTDSGGLGGKTMVQIFAEYAPYGLSYNEAEDRLYLNGVKVRTFTDIMESNGESLSSGNFKGAVRSMGRPNGVIDVIAVRNANGVLTGLRVASQTEYDERTKDWAQGALAHQRVIITGEPEYNSTYITEGTPASTAAPGTMEDTIDNSDVMEVMPVRNGTGPFYEAVFKMPDGRNVGLGSYDSYVQRYEGVKAFCDAECKAGRLSQIDADSILDLFD